jgi:hypothetical protein
LASLFSEEGGLRYGLWMTNTCWEFGWIGTLFNNCPTPLNCLERICALFEYLCSPNTNPQNDGVFSFLFLYVCPGPFFHQGNLPLHLDLTADGFQ